MKKGGNTLSCILAVIMGGLMLANLLSGMFYLRNLFCEYAPGGLFAQTEQENVVSEYDLSSFVTSMLVDDEIAEYYRENRVKVIGANIACVLAAAAATVFTMIEIVRPGNSWRIRVIAIAAILWEAFNLLIVVESGMEISFHGYVLAGLSALTVLAAFLPKMEISALVKRLILVAAGFIMAGYCVIYFARMGYGGGMVELVDGLIYTVQMYYDAAGIPTWATVVNFILDYGVLLLLMAGGIFVLVCAVTGTCRLPVKVMAWSIIGLSCVEIVYTELASIGRAVLYFDYSWVAVSAVPLVVLLLIGSEQDAMASLGSIIIEMRNGNRLKKSIDSFVANIGERMSTGESDDAIIAMIGDNSGEKAEQALLIECVRYKRYKVAKSLLTGGTDPDARDDMGYTALMHAVLENDLEMVRLLVSGGADVNAADREKNTALYMCNGADGLAVLKFLIEAGADVNVRNRDGEMPVDYYMNDPRFRAVLNGDDDCQTCID